MNNEFEYGGSNGENTNDALNMNYEYNTSYNMQPMTEDMGPVSLGDWIVTMIVGAIPVVGLIVYIVWAFGNTVNPSKKNYCRACLIFSVISIALCILFAVIFGIAFMTGMDAGYGSL